MFKIALLNSNQFKFILFIFFFIPQWAEDDKSEDTTRWEVQIE